MRSYIIIGIVSFIVGGVCTGVGLYLGSQRGLVAIKEENNRIKESLYRSTIRVRELEIINRQYEENNRKFKSEIEDLRGTISGISDSINRGTAISSGQYRLIREIEEILNKY